MLVLGWTIMGRKRSSYDYTMGFGVSARVAQKSTRWSVTPPHMSSIKSNGYHASLNLNCHPLSEERARLGGYELVKTTKMPYSDCKQSSGMTGLLSGMTGLLSGMTIKDWLKGGGYGC